MTFGWKTIRKNVVRHYEVSLIRRFGHVTILSNDFRKFFIRQNNDSAKLHFGKTTIRWNSVSGKWCGPIIFLHQQFNISIIFIRYFTFMDIAFYISPPLFPPFLRLRPARNSTPPPLPSWESDCSHSLLYCIAFARGHWKIAENLCRYSRPLYIVRSHSTVSENMTSGSAFRCAHRGPTVTHPSTDPAPRCLTWVIDWYRTTATYQTLSIINN